MKAKCAVAVGVSAVFSISVVPSALAARSVGDRVAVATSSVKDAARLPAAAASASVSFAVQLPLRHAGAADAFVTAVSTPGSKQYGHYLSPTQFNQRFAPTAAQVNVVKKFLTGHGMRVVAVPGNNRYVQASGPVAAVNAMFGVKVRTNVRAAGHPMVADRSLTVPASIAPNILTVTGLEGVVAKPGIRGADGPGAVGTHQMSPKAAAGTRNTINTPCSSFWSQHTATMPTAYNKDGFPTAICGYNSDQLQAAYGVQGKIAAGTDGRGQTVAIVDAYNLPTMQQDADTYFGAQGENGFRKGQYKAVLPRSFDDQSDCGEAGWNSEQVLDVETTHGLAPGANILYAAAKDCSYQGLLDPLNAIVNKHSATIVSNSWGFFGESTIPTSIVQATHAVLVQAAAEGIGMYFCTLDNGDQAANAGTPQAVYPASDPDATAVGGTTLGIDGDGSRAVEAGWGSTRAGVTYDASGEPNGYSSPLPGQFYIGAGGGSSTLFAQPAYQRGVVPRNLSTQYSTTPMRVEPDIAADADPYTGYLIGYTVPGSTYQTESYGGTSLATPIIAALVAVASQGRKTPIGFANPLLYRAKTRSSILDIRPSRVPVAMAFTSNLMTSLCYQSCLITTDRDTSLQTGTGFDAVTGLGAPKDGRFITALHNG